MNTISISPKVLLGGLFVGFFLFLLFVPAFQVQAVLGGACTQSSDCGGFSCNTSTAVGVCVGPCTSNAECAATATSLGWGGTKCTGNSAIAEVKGACAGSTPCGNGTACSAKTGTPLACSTPFPTEGGACTAGNTGCVGGNPAKQANNGVCLELPRSGSGLADTAPATTGAQLLTLVDTVTNWVFAIFVVLAIIF